MARCKQTDAAADSPPSPRPDDLVNVKIRRSKHAKLKALASLAGKDLVEYLDQIIGRHLAVEGPKVFRNDH